MDSKGVHILMVDDEEDSRVIFEFNFEEEVENGVVKVSYASSGDGCLDLLKTPEGADVDLILLDINMPGKDGFEVLKVVSEEYPNIAVHMVSAYGSEDFINRSYDGGAKEFYIKPVDFDVLKETIMKHFDVKLIIG